MTMHATSSIPMRKSANTVRNRLRPDRRDATRWVIAAFYLVAGYFHLAAPAPFLQIMPDWVPYPVEVVYWTGIAEIAGAAALLQPAGPLLRKAGAIGLALYALCVWPANANHMLIDMARGDGGLGMAYHVPRMLAQPLLIWATLWCARVTDWPFGNRSGRS